MGFLKSVQGVFGPERRSKHQGATAGPQKTITPVIVHKGELEKRGVPKAGASDGELTPTQGRPYLPLRHTDSQLPPHAPYGHQIFAQSQPALGHGPASPGSGFRRPSRPPPAPQPPPQSPLPAIPQGSEAFGPLTPPRLPYGSHAIMLRQRSAGELRGPAKAFEVPTLARERQRIEPGDASSAVPDPRALGHRRGQGNHALPESSAQSPTGLEQGRYIPDYSSVPSGSSISSSYLTRGPSTISTSHSELRPGSSRPSQQAWGVQQDFFLAGLNLTSSQKRLLLVGLPYEVVQTYRRMYANDLDGAGPHEHQALAQEQLRARSDLTLVPKDQQNVLLACVAVQATLWGNERLARLVRWALQPELEEQSFLVEYEVRRVPALSAQQLREILRPLHLDAGQQARLNKHCSTIPAEPVRPMLPPGTFPAPF